MEVKGVMSFKRDEYLFNAIWNREIQYKDYTISVGFNMF